jgi:hypothetical protein
VDHPPHHTLHFVGLYPSLYVPVRTPSEQRRSYFCAYTVLWVGVKGGTGESKLHDFCDSEGSSYKATSLT